MTDLDTQETEKVVQIEFGPNDRKFTDIAIDSESGHIYWARYSDQTPPEGWYLVRSDMSGTLIDTVYSSLTASFSGEGVCTSPRQIALDTPRHFYWTYSIWGPDGICRADLTTGDTEQIIPAGNTDGIAVDSEVGKVYFTKPQGEIIRCNLDGSEPETLAHLPFREEAPGIDIALDNINEKIYWAADDAVWRANLDGSEAEIVVAGDFYRLAVDPHSDSVFMTDSTGIYHTALDGGGLERIVEHNWPGHLALYRASASTTVEPVLSIFETISLSPNFPNPFTSTTTIKYALGAPSYVTLVVYDMLGREINQLVSGMKGVGQHEVTFDAAQLPKGVYMYRLESGTSETMGKMMLHQ